MPDACIVDDSSVEGVVVVEVEEAKAKDVVGRWI